MNADKDKGHAWLGTCGQDIGRAEFAKESDYTQQDANL